MSSNIYYPERKLMRDKMKPPGVLGKLLGRALGIKPPEEEVFQSSVITVENVLKILDLPTIGMSIDRKLAPFHNFSFRGIAMDYEYPEMGAVFIPQNIHMTDGVRDYFIVLIENELEVRYWPGYRTPNNDPNKLKTYAVIDKGILADIERSFAALLDTTGVNKTFDEKYENVKPTIFTKEELDFFLSLIHPEFDIFLSVDIYNAAANPVGFYKDNAARLKEKGYMEPFEGMYRQLLLDTLADSNIMRTLDRKASWDDIELAIVGISKGRYTNMFTTRDGYSADTAYFLTLAAGRMLNKGLILMCIDNSRYAYNIMLISEKEVATVMASAARCSIMMNRFLDL